MNNAAGNYHFVSASAAHLAEQFSKPSEAVTNAIVAATKVTSDTEVEQHRTDLYKLFSEARDKSASETPEPYTHYASRHSAVGIYQSILSAVFSDIPGFQGYGNHNPIWVITLLEEGAYRLKSFFHEVYEIRGAKKPLLEAIVEAWKDLRLERAAYPTGTPAPIAFDDSCTIALMADWGGDNPAAKNVASIVHRAQPLLVIHLGDIYYGGVKEECQAFLRNWPMQADALRPGSDIPAGTSYALNGNHEMYSGGESFFDLVLLAFRQPQPFFCLENTHWRIIGLDSAYLNGRIKPRGPEDEALTDQWNWLVDLLRNDSGRANIFLTHHQPVSAHQQEHDDSAALRADIDDLLSTEGIRKDSIFGWFFGHEHRCTVYQDQGTSYNARLIGSGCIPHEIQREVNPDSGCTPFVWVSGRGEDGSKNAISCYAELRFMREWLEIVYTDERGTSLGKEQWNALKGRLNGVPFEEDRTGFLNV